MNVKREGAVGTTGTSVGGRTAQPITDAQMLGSSTTSA
jgi:hypothetical protein